MLINKMKYMKDLTNQEKHVVDYILQNPETIFKVTANELAKQTFTSSSTIVRLCKKFGTKGYPDFQLQFALEYRNSNLTEQLLHRNEGDNKEFFCTSKKVILFLSIIPLLTILSCNNLSNLFGRYSQTNS